MLDRHCSLSIKVESLGETVLMTGVGEIDATNLSVFIDVLASVRPTPGTTLIVDAGQLDFVAFQAVQVLVFAASRFANLGCELLIARAKPVVRRVLDILGVDPRLLLLDEVAS